MNVPRHAAPPLLKKYLPLLLLMGFLPAAACGGKILKETEARPADPVVPSKPQLTISTWLGNPTRSFYGTGPWSNRPLQVIWEFETKFITGRLHEDPWGGTSWPGQPSVDETHVYFPSADGRVYCLDVRDGSLVWSFKAEDSFKATPTIAGERLLASGLDHYLYCLNRSDGSLIWKFKSGFEIDGATSVVDGRVYFGGEDGFYYCLNLDDGSLIYKTQWLGSMEGSSTIVDDRIYVATEQGYLICLQLADGSIIWKARINSDSNSTPAVADGLVYTAAENGIVYCFRQSDGELVWTFKALGGTTKDRSGFWASPIIANGKLYIGSSNNSMYCLTADKGELLWQWRGHAPIWGTAPVIDDRLVFGDKAGWLHVLSAADGRAISELKIGDNINSTPAVLRGRVYIGAFNGKLYCLN
jgi:outer membrane protein assembly factor BamB